jgi:hypothetical protein
LGSWRGRRRESAEEEEEKGRERGATKMFIQKVIIMPPNLVNRADNARAGIILLWLLSRVCDLR